jgi:hypothetical protein
MDSRRAIRPPPARAARDPNWLLGFPAVDIGSGNDWRKPLKFCSPVLGPTDLLALAAWLSPVGCRSLPFAASGSGVRRQAH